MLKLIGRVSKRLIGGYVSSDSEVKLEPHARGIVVRSLPRDLEREKIAEALKAQFNPLSLDLKTDAMGSPAYAVLRFNEEKQVKAAAAVEKLKILGKKVNVCVWNI